MRLEIVKRPRDTEGFPPAAAPVGDPAAAFAWLGRNRRLAKDFERLHYITTAIAYLAIIQLLMRRLART